MRREDEALVRMLSEALARLIVNFISDDKTPPEGAPRLLKVGEVAGRLNVSKNHVYQLVNSRQLPSIKLGEAVRVLESDLDEFIRRGTRSRGVAHIERARVKELLDRIDIKLERVQ